MVIFTVLGFSAQLVFIASIISAIISCASLPHSCIVVTSEDHPTGAVVSVDEDDSDATLPCASSYTYEDDGCLGVSCLVTFEPSSDDLSLSTVKELRALARERGIKGVSSLRKHELLLAIQDSYLFT